ncbi:MAG TPA: hypothetical protein VFG83_16190 [Kofleriaceae bacterium]|nr:hypothetical protein [Kofleriaceae bacterium]
MVAANAIAGCDPEPEPGITPDATEISDATAPEPDAGDSQPARLMGTWQRIDDAGVVQDQFIFDSDGFQYDAFEDDPQHLAGSYTTTDHQLVMDGVTSGQPGSTRVEASYYATDSSLGIGAFFPQGTHNGAVGSWHGHHITRTLDASGDETMAIGATGDLTLSDDQTAHFEITPADGSPLQTYDGTWTAQGADIYETAFEQADITINFTFHLDEDAALSQVVYSRAQAAHRQSRRVSSRPWWAARS